jgi:hypothetical protein
MIYTPSQLPGAAPERHKSATRRAQIKKKINGANNLALTPPECCRA